MKKILPMGLLFLIDRTPQNLPMIQYGMKRLSRIVKQIKFGMKALKMRRIKHKPKGIYGHQIISATSPGQKDTSSLIN